LRRLAIVALFAGLWSAGCVQSPKPPYELAFDAVVESPRVLTSSDEITVPLTVVNTGRRAWDPASVHVSYHWLWPIPRELVRRSRTVPYQDGIRTEVGDRAIPAGARVGPPVTTRQADEISRKWEERFRAERPSAYSPASG